MQSIYTSSANCSIGLPSPFYSLFILILMVLGFGCADTKAEKHTVEVELSVDREKNLAPGRALNSGTQSINRYHSILRTPDKARFEHDPERGLLDITLLEKGQPKLNIQQLETQFLVPLLPYAHGGQIDAFDRANLLLAEFARNGIQISYQEQNEAYGFFHANQDFFNEEGEYRYVNQRIEPNPGVRPVRMSVVNNCLHPGLWELNATDAVGEMYHSWLQLPTDFYFELMRSQNEIGTSVEELTSFFAKDQMEGIRAELSRLRQRGDLLLRSEATVVGEKEIGGYSSQDSRRKVQRGFYRIYRDTILDTPERFSELVADHTFKLHAFVPPGIYDHTSSFDIPYRPEWGRVEIYEVEPLTSYGYPKTKWQEQGSLEIVLHSEDGQRALVAGNIPVSLLVMGADYSIPAFGAGVLSSSELIERRYLRVREGPLPHYAYLLQKDGTDFTLINNHKVGYEQIFLRPFRRGDELLLRLTVVSYERIVDLLEFEIPITGPLRDRLLRAEQQYQPPAYEVYSDSNLL